MAAWIGPGEVIDVRERERDRVAMRERQRDHAGPGARQTSGGWVRPIPELLDRLEDACPCAVVKRSLAVQDIRDGRDGHPGFLRHVPDAGRASVDRVHGLDTANRFTIGVEAQ